ncbi:hypothetical protein CH289_07900 [Rhodococcus sp. RS1C4]|nr:hypothetical protein [Rhodococcus sp. RS1C4]OZC55105.1 hypothetical protein CH289_07900 [Rhodococcus sp. RS1C4]
MSEIDIIAESIKGYVAGFLDGYGPVDDNPKDQAFFAAEIAENLPEVLSERLSDAGYSIVGPAAAAEEDQ